jgi:hypothetical protein
MVSSLLHSPIPIPFHPFPSPTLNQNVALREKAKEVERHARAKYAEAKAAIKAANEAREAVGGCTAVESS